MHPKDADGMANSVDPDQTASSEAVWSWSALFAETYLSQYIEFIRYTCINPIKGITSTSQANESTNYDNITFLEKTSIFIHFLFFILWLILLA